MPVELDPPVPIKTVPIPSALLLEALTAPSLIVTSRERFVLAPDKVSVPDPDLVNAVPLVALKVPPKLWALLPLLRVKVFPLAMLTSPDPAKLVSV